jgi:lysophospholipase L1-like esterase
MKTMIVALALLCAGIVQAAEFQKVLFLGNSITLHGPSKKVDWSGNWGMAASAKDKDYVHLVTKALAKKDGTSPETLVNNIATFERQYAAYDAAQFKDAAAFGADLIIVCIGENVPNLATEEAKTQFKDSVVKMLNGIKGDRKPLIVVRSCFWANAAKDAALKQACSEVGGIFVDIGALSKDEKNYARSERTFKHAGVANHPGDRGMQATADAIVGAVQAK